MSTIPRLDPAADPFHLEGDIPAELVPYFNVWYQDNKNIGESPKEFAFRALKFLAKKYYAQKDVKEYSELHDTDIKERQADIDKLVNE